MTDVEYNFTEADLHACVLGFLDLIEPGLILRQSQVPMAGGYIDLWCTDIAGRDTFIELEYAPVNANSIGQALRYKAQLERRSGEFPNYRFMFYVPAIRQGDRETLEGQGIEIIVYDRIETDQRLELYRIARQVLDSIHAVLARPVSVVGGETPLMMPLIDACFTTKVQHPATHKMVYGWRKQTAGVMLQMMECVARSNWHSTNPLLAVKLLVENCIAPLYVAYKGTGRVDTFHNQLLALTKGKQRILRDYYQEIWTALTTFLEERPVDRDPWEVIATDLQHRTGQAHRIPANVAHRFVTEYFNFQSQYTDQHGISYANNMGYRILELLTLRRICFANPGPGGGRILLYDDARRQFKFINPQSFDLIFRPTLYRDLAALASAL